VYEHCCDCKEVFEDKLHCIEFLSFIQIKMLKLGMNKTWSDQEGAIEKNIVTLTYILNTVKQTKTWYL
jgi:hypothetical protein